MWNIGTVECSVGELTPAIVVIHYLYRISVSRETRSRSHFESWVTARWKYNRMEGSAAADADYASRHQIATWMSDWGVPPECSREEIIDAWIGWRKLPRQVAVGVVPPFVEETTP